MLGPMPAPQPLYLRSLPIAVTVLLPVVLTTALLVFAAAMPNGSVPFYLATFAAAGVLIGAWALFGNHARSFPRDPRRIWTGVARGLGVGLLLLLGFTLAAFLLRYLPFLAAPVEDLLSNVALGGTAITLATTLLNGVGEEMFFRNAVVARLREKGWSETWVFIGALAAYLVVTAGLMVPLLPLAGLALGAVAHWEAERTGALYSPIVLHLTWSTGMFFLLPVVL